MTDLEKKQEFLKLANQVLDEQAVPYIKKSMVKLLESGAIDLDAYDTEINKMILPKILLVVALEEEANQYKPKRTSYEKEVSKEIENLKLFV